MPLSDIKIRNAKPAEKPFELYDERVLFLIVTPAGGKWWRFKYQFEVKEKLLSLGIYPDISLREARDRRDDARKLVIASCADSNVTYSHGSGHARLPKCRRQIFWPSHEELSTVARLKRPTERSPTVDRSSAMPWPPDAPCAILRATCVAPYPQSKGRIFLPSPNPRRWLNC